MGFFDGAPPKRVTQNELHEHVMGQLRNGEHNLSSSQAEHLHSVLGGYMDSDSATKKYPGLTAEELPGLIDNLKSGQHSSSSTHFTDGQIGKIEHVLKTYIDKEGGL